jgi:hypothetical protein
MFYVLFRRGFGFRFMSNLHILSSIFVRVSFMSIDNISIETPLNGIIKCSLKNFYNLRFCFGRMSNLHIFNSIFALVLLLSIDNISFVIPVNGSVKCLLKNFYNNRFDVFEIVHRGTANSRL